MGINGLSAFLREKFGDIFTDVHISHYRFKKVAIDTSIFLYKYKRAVGNTGWLQLFIDLVLFFRKNDVHVVFVYDGKALPDKKTEQEKRKIQILKLLETINTLIFQLEEYKKAGVVGDLLRETNKKQPLLQKRLLFPTDENVIDIHFIEMEIEKKQRQAIQITPEDFHMTRKLFDAMNVPYIRAEIEAETLCSWLCISGKVDAVVSEDTDILAYGAPVFLSKIETSTGLCKEIVFENVLENLELSKESFLDFCIMCGCDYNSNIPKVGCVGAYKLIKEHVSIDNLPEKYDKSILNHTRVRELFTDYKKDENISIPFCREPDYERLTEFCRENDCRVDIESLKRVFEPKLIFEDEN